MKFVASASRTLLLLAPSQRAVPARFARLERDARCYDDLLAEAQTFRGRIYMQDGAIKPWQLTDGRHELDIDYESWHLLVLDHHGHVCGCIRYREYPCDVSFSDLSVAQSALARSEGWGSMLRDSVQAELDLSEQLDCPVSESGGWALEEDIRGTAEALRLVLASYALAEELGGAIVLSTVTKRHDSASILGRMGGQPLEWDGLSLPSYYDPQYECKMEILRFYSWAPNPRYRVWINEIKASLWATRVIAGNATGAERVTPIRTRRMNQEVRSASAG